MSRKVSLKEATIKNWIYKYKQDSRCVRCGFKHHAALQFHHTGIGRKEFEISSAISLGKSLIQIQEEIDKCEVICANCHLIHHYEERIENESNNIDLLDEEYYEN